MEENKDTIFTESETVNESKTNSIQNTTSRFETWVKTKLTTLIFMIAELFLVFGLLGAIVFGFVVGDSGYYTDFEGILVFLAGFISVVVVFIFLFAIGHVIELMENQLSVQKNIEKRLELFSFRGESKAQVEGSAKPKSVTIKKKTTN